MNRSIEVFPQILHQTDFWDWISRFDLIQVLGFEPVQCSFGFSFFLLPFALVLRLEQVLFLAPSVISLTLTIDPTT